MVEDVTTSGKSIDETYPVLKGAADVDVKGLIVSLNRMEVGKGGVVTAQQEVQEKYGFPVASIVSMAEVTECLLRAVRREVRLSRPPGFFSCSRPSECEGPIDAIMRVDRAFQEGRGFWGSATSPGSSRSCGRT